MTIDSRAVVGAFATFSDAQRAADLLFQAGFSRIRIARNDLEEASVHESQNTALPEHKKSGLAGFFSRLFGIEDDRPTLKLDSDSEAYFQEKYHSRHHLVVVEKCPDPVRCREIMNSMGGSIEDQGSHHYESGLQRYSGTTPSPAIVGNSEFEAVSGSDKAMELREEILDVHVDRVQTGEVRVHKEIITETKTIEVPVSREEIVVERLPLEEGASLRGDQIEEIRIPVSEEQVHIEKKVVPREEIRVAKEKITETETYTVDVSHEETRLELLPSTDSVHSSSRLD